MAKGGVRVQILSEFDPKGFERAQKEAQGFSDQMKNLAKTTAAAFATREVVNFAKSTVAAASDLGESINAVNVTFGEAADGILALGENASTAVGLSAREFNAFAVQFSGFTQQIAGAGGDIAAVTDDLTTRIADFASVMNMDVPEAAQVFQSALAGETEPIRRFGIDMSAAAVEAHALATGLIESKSEMTEAIKVQARYSLLMASTNKVAGDFANTSDSLANQQRILAARMDDAKATIGQAMIPALESVLNVIMPVLDAFTALPEDLQQVITVTALLAVGMKSASTALQGFGLSASTANKMAGGLGVTIGAGLLILNQYTTAKNQVAAASERVKTALDAETGAVTENSRNLIRQQLLTGELGKAMEMLGLDVDLATEAIMGNDEAAYEFIDTINKADQELVGLGDGFKSLFTSEMQNIDAVRIVRREYQGMRSGLEDARNEADRLSDAVDENSEATRTAITDYGHFADAMQVTNGALNAQKDATEALLEARQAEQDELYGTITGLVQAGEAAGYSTEQTRELIRSLGYLDGVSVEAQIELGLVSDVEQALITLDAMILTIQAGVRAMGGDAKDVVASTRELVDLRNELRRIANEPASTGGGGGGGGGFVPLPEIDEVENEFDDFVDEVVRYANDLMGRDFAESLFEGSRESINDVWRELMEELPKMAAEAADATLSAALATMAPKFQELMALADVRDELQSQLDGIREVQQAARDLFTTGLEAETGTKASDLKEQLRSRVAMAQRFVMHLRKLQGMGFPPSIIQDVVNAGIIDGGTMARELAKFSPEEVAQVTEQVAAIERAQKAAGDIVGDLLGEGEVERALVDTNTEMKRLADAIQFDLNDAFSAFLSGLGAEIDRLGAPAGVSGFPSPLASHRPAEKVEVHVHMPAGSNGEDVVRAVRKYARNTGTLPIPVTDKVRT